MNNLAPEYVSVPETPEAECAIIAALVSPVDGKLAAEVIFKAVEPRHFYDTGRSRILSTMLEIHRDGGVIDKVTVSNMLRNRGLLESVGGPEAFSPDVNVIADEEHLAVWIKAVHEAWASRELIRLAHDVTNPANPRSAVDVLAEAQQRLSGVENVLKGHGRRKRWAWVAQGHYFERRPPAPEWDATGLLPKDDAPVLLYGEPASFKSFIVLHIAACMATGDSVFGRFPVPAVRTPAMFINFDAGHAAFTRRLFKLGSRIDTLLTSSPDNYDPSEFVATFEEFRGAWIAADSVSDMYVPTLGREQGADAREFFRSIRGLYQANGAGGMLIDHTNRSKAGPEAYYGSVQKMAAVRNAWHVEVVPNPPTGVNRVKLTCTKMSEDEKWLPFYLDIRFDDDRLHLEYAGPATDGGFISTDALDFEAVERILATAPNGLTRTAIQSMTSIPRDRVRAALESRRIVASGPLSSPTRTYKLVPNLLDGFT